MRAGRCCTRGRATRPNTARSRKGTSCPSDRRIVAKRTLPIFREAHPRSRAGRSDWYTRVSAADGNSPDDVGAEFGNGIDFVGNNGIVFDIRRNEFHMIVHVSHRYERVLIRFAGTHAEDGRIAPETVA